MKKYTVSGFALVTIGVRYTEIMAISEKDAAAQAVRMFNSGDKQLTSDIDEATAFSFDPLNADIET